MSIELLGFLAALVSALAVWGVIVFLCFGAIFLWWRIEDRRSLRKGGLK